MSAEPIIPLAGQIRRCRPFDVYYASSLRVSLDERFEGGNGSEQAELASRPSRTVSESDKDPSSIASEALNGQDAPGAGSPRLSLTPSGKGSKDLLRGGIK